MDEEKDFDEVNPDKEIDEEEKSEDDSEEE